MSHGWSSDAFSKLTTFPSTTKREARHKGRDPINAEKEAQLRRQEARRRKKRRSNTTGLWALRQGKNNQEPPRVDPDAG
jgi:hypothetical protein